MAEEDPKLSALVWDPSWTSLSNKKDSGQLSRVRTQAREEWVVQLKFTINGDKKEGTGFFINVPTAESCILLTAGHNLVDSNNNRTEDLEIHHMGENIPANEFQREVCPQYHQSSNGRDPDHDYGVILVPEHKIESPKKPGFGFALALSEENLKGRILEVTGYYPDKNASASNGVRTSSGKCLNSLKGSLEYQIDTEAGLSGSPVWIPYREHETVVAIHNNGPESSHEIGNKKGSMGARLSAEVLQQISKWAGVFHQSKALKAIEKKGKPADPLYLDFQPNEQYAWVHWGHEGLRSFFNVFPAYAPTSEHSAHPLHVFQHCVPPDCSESEKKKQWVLWDFKVRGVKLTDTLQPSCFVYMDKVEVARKSATEHAYYIVLSSGLSDESQNKLDAQLWNLVMTSGGLNELDIEDGILTAPGLSFTKRLKGQRAGKGQYFTFYLE